MDAFTAGGGTVLPALLRITFVIIGAGKYSVSSNCEVDEERTNTNPDPFRCSNFAPEMSIILKIVFLVLYWNCDVPRCAHK